MGIGGGPGWWTHPPAGPHKIEEDLKEKVEWTEADARYFERHAAFNEFYAEYLRRKDKE